MSRMDDPEVIIELIKGYPEFKTMYEQVYEICRNVEGMMGIFSEELKIMDHNTVRYMVDQMQEQLDRQKKQLEDKDREIYRLQELLKEKQ